MAARQPNVLFIMADQFRSDYYGAAGADFLRTPAIDSLAGRGTRFTRAYTNCPVCAPARIGLATGLYPFRTGALENRAYAPLSHPTYYQRIRDAGYRVAMVGKHDLTKSDREKGDRGDRPLNYSFGFTDPHETLGKMEAGHPRPPSCPYTHRLAEAGLFEAFRDDYTARAQSGWIRDASHDSVLPTEHYHDGYIGEYACGWLERVGSDFPWHLFVSFVGPHDPLDPPAEYGERYRDAPMPTAIEDSQEGKPHWHESRHSGLTDKAIAVTRRQYCAEIELIDDYVGRMLGILEERGMLDNTVVVFTSDHGEMLGDHGIYQKSIAYEGAVHIPLVIAGPGIESNQVSNALVGLIDLNPTICDIAGCAPQSGIDARSLLPVLAGRQQRIRESVYISIRHFQCVVTDRYKLVENYNDVNELYDLDRDPEELSNLIDAEPDRARAMLSGEMAEPHSSPGAK